ncbi:hypothetical protein GCM10018781_62840 [Kitasatospora indigofera]|uniref:Uncharacterized protein n=1 Tax=Kitasatospora indigofera TaxID=67307 RepID=A0A919GBC4_9ACTN|nr:hypothetical protein GCM10018781_62840 [Kitasatospora indigofera]
MPPRAAGGAPAREPAAVTTTGMTPAAATAGGPATATPTAGLPVRSTLSPLAHPGRQAPPDNRGGPPVTVRYDMGAHPG